MRTHTPQPLPVADGLAFRALAPADARLWLELIERIAQAEDAGWHEQASDLAAVLESQEDPVALNTTVGVDDAGVPRAYGYVSKNPQRDWGYAFGGVDPLWQRRGIGAAVLAWQEDLLLDRFAADGQGQARVRSYTQEINPAHTGLLTRAGYAAVRYFSEMLRPLAEVPKAGAPRGVHLVPFSRGLGESVRLAHNEAFADHWGSAPRSAHKWGFLLNHENFRPAWSTVALDAATGEVAGYQLSMYDPLRFASVGREEGYTEILGVRRPWRGRGVGPALLADAMARFKADGMDYACLDVDTENPTGALGLYLRMGYTPLRRTVAWDKAL